VICRCMLKTWCKAPGVKISGVWRGELVCASSNASTPPTREEARRNAVTRVAHADALCGRRLAE